MTDDLSAPFVVDSRMQDGIRELLVYKLATDSWGRPYYTPMSGLGPLTEYEASCLCTALGLSLGVLA